MMVTAVRDSLADQVVRSVDEARAADQDALRWHLGASVIGKACEREIWYGFRWAKWLRHPGRVLRLFDRGKREEQVFLASLQRVPGVAVRAVGKDGKQFMFSRLGGHYGGSLDGIAKGLPGAADPKEWYLLEFKTSNRNAFRELQAKGVLDAKPVHYYQMQVYMAWSNIKRALYLCVCKDTDELYSEEIEADPAVAEAMQEKAIRIIKAPTPPERPCAARDPQGCKWCDYAAICWSNGRMMETCRTCAHSSPALDEASHGSWYCSRHGFSIEHCVTAPDTLKCPQYEAIV